MLDDFERSLSKAACLVEQVSNVDMDSPQAELVRLKKLCVDLITTISANQTAIPDGMQRFCDNPTADRWSYLQHAISLLATNVGRMFVLLQREEGDFVIDGLETYRSLVLGLAERKRLYQEIQEMTFPVRAEDLERIRKLATDYERLVNGLFKCQKEIADYIKQRRTLPTTTEIKPGILDDSAWYISYAWGDDLTPDGREREKIVDQICEAAAAQGHCVLRDKEVLALGDSISNLMRRIGNGGRIIVVLSDKYLRSPHCMFELSEIWRTSRQESNAFLERVRVFSLPDARVLRPTDWADWAIYWKQQYEELESRARQHGLVVLGEQGHRRLTHMRSFYNDVSDILGTLADIVQPRTLDDFERYGFDERPRSSASPKVSRGS